MADKNNSSTKKNEAKAETSKNESAKETHNSDNAKAASNPLSSLKTVKRSYVIAVVAIILLGALGYYLAKQMIVARVNNEYIFRPAYMKELEKAAGQQILEGIATKKMIEQEAKKKYITVSDQEIDGENADYSTLHKRNQKN